MSPKKPKMKKSLTSDRPIRKIRPFSSDLECRSLRAAIANNPVTFPFGMLSRKGFGRRPSFARPISACHRVRAAELTASFRLEIAGKQPLKRKIMQTSHYKKCLSDK